MNEKLKKDMDKIKLDPKVKEDTLMLMKKSLKEEKKMKNSHKKLLIPAVAFLVIIALVLAIPRLGKDNMEKGNSPNIAFAEDLMKDVEGNDIEDLKELPKEFTKGNYKFSLDVFKELLEEENPVFSPTPIYLSLGLIQNGTDEKARDEIVKLIGESNLSQEDINLYYKFLKEDLSENKADTELNISNSIWYDKDFKANNDFLEKNKTYYDADAYKMDFRDKKSTEAINEWVEKVTKGKIDKMVDEIGEDTVMLLYSSIYFDGKWKVPFPKEKTYEMSFFTRDDGEIEVPMMSNSLDVKNFIKDGETGIVFPYNDERFEFLALMPQEGQDIREYVKKLDIDKINDKISQMEENRVRLVLPKFEKSFESSLKDVLVKMGVEKIFDPNAKSLQNMGESLVDLYVGSIKQKTYIRVDEEGTEAASVVESTIEETSMAESIEFNRPFLYGVIDKESKLPIFLGVMDNPKK